MPNHDVIRKTVIIVLKAKIDAMMLASNQNYSGIYERFFFSAEIPFLSRWVAAAVMSLEQDTVHISTK